MKLLEILEKYDTSLLDQIAADKVDETITLRLPQSVIIQEIISALSSQSYVSNKILYGKPPTYAILNIVIQSSGTLVDVEGFKEKVIENVNQLKESAKRISNLNGKNDALYIKILKRAWENDNLIDKSEAHILELVKQEFGIWDREHYTLMHDESIIGLWDVSQEYYFARNQLLASGILLTYEGKYVVAEEVAVQVRKTFGIEMMDDAFKRMLDHFGKEDLSQILNALHLNVSGAKNLLIDRIVDCLAPPTDILNLIPLDVLREVCRRLNIHSSGAKNLVVSNLIRHFDENRDLVTEAVPEEKSELPIEPEVREMNIDSYVKVLMSLTGQQLYDILYQASLMTSGTKDDKVKRILQSPWSERSMFNRLRKEDIALLCRRFSLQVSGSKMELIDRLLDYVPPENIHVQGITEDLPAVQTNSTVELKDNESPVTTEAPSLPSKLEEVKILFPDLQNDEKIVVAVLIEAKSLTERDLERIVTKYQLGWFLHKAHMAELMAKLRRANKEFIQIKSIQNSNIYQWVAFDKSNEILEKKSARDIIDALRHGVVPKNNLDILMVGQQTARKHLSEILMEVGTHKSHFKFIRGQYGSGKTFLCSWLKEFALHNEFAVSFINIGHDQPLSDLPIFFSGMINGLRTQEKSDSSALVDILESWLLNIHNKTASIEGIDATNVQSQKLLSSIVEKSIEVELAGFNDIESGFAQALRAFYEGKRKGDMELVSNAVAWLTGSRSLSSQALRDVGVKGYLEPNSVFPRMRAILEIINGARYKGLLLLVDELELIRKFPHARQREQAFETLRLLIDEAGRNALPGCLIIFTGTDEFFEDERYGLRSYEALAERVMTLFEHEDFVSMRQPIISLESLNNERLKSVIYKIRNLYGIAYSCDAMLFADDISVGKLIDNWTIFGGENIDRKPRPILREFIQMLDLCEENKVNLSEFIKTPLLEVSPVVTISEN